MPMQVSRLGLGWALAISLPALAQTFGEITGEIRDPSGAVVGGTAVTATNKATMATRATVTNEAGVYSLPSLQPGIYDLKVAKEGFRSITRNDIELQVQQSVRIGFTLQVGEVSEAIEVRAGSPLMAQEGATVGTLIENKRIVELPLNGRNFLQLVSLSPNVSFGFGNAGFADTRQGGSRTAQNMAIAGQRNWFNHFTLDGVENTDVNFNTYIILPSIDALQEFKVQSGIYPAEFGRQASQINVSTKAGGNEFHGALFEFLRNDKLDAKAYAFTTLRPPKEPFKWNQYGFTLSGPVWIPKLYNGRNRLFFLSNFEGYRDRKQLRGVYNVPAAAMRGGDFSGIAVRIFDPLTRAGGGNPIAAQPFAGNVIPLYRIHPTSVKLLAFLPEPNVNTGSLASNYQVGLNRVIDKDQFTQRVDLVESNASSWFGRYSWGDEQQFTPALKLNGTKLLTNVKQAMISNTRAPSPAVVNEFRFGYSQFLNSALPELAFVRDVVGELKIPGVALLPPSAWAMPSVAISGFTQQQQPGAPGTFGFADGPYVNRNHIFQWVDNLSWVHGKHSFRVGAEIRRDRYNEAGNAFSQGRFSFSGIATENPASRNGTGYGFADYLLGQIRQSSAAVALAVTQFRATSQYYYFDDAWKLRPSLTLSLGLRYENTPPWSDRSGTIVNAHISFVDTTPNVADLSRHPTLVRIGNGDFYENTVMRFNPAIKVARDGRLGDRLVTRDNNDFAPRLGLAWSPSARWNLRAGVGVFYSQDASHARFDMGRNLAGRRGDVASADFPDLSWDRPFRSLGGSLQIDTPDVTANSHQRRTPYTLQYVLNVQRELASETLLEAGYIGSGGRKLERLRFWNQPIPSPTGSVASRSPYPEFGLIQNLEGIANSSYHSLGVKLQRRFIRGLTYMVGYTWSRSIDTSSAIRPNLGDVAYPVNSYCIRCERGLSNFHTAHRLVASTLYELPFGKGKKYFKGGRTADTLLGGWQLGSILTMQSGFPFTVIVGRDQANIGNPNPQDRPNATGIAAALPRGQRDPEHFFNTAAFALQPFGSFGNAGRNSVIGPGLISWDFSTLKNFRVKEAQQLQFRFEAFNLPNHPNWAIPGNTLIGADFAKIRSTRTPMRELQFGLKYIF